MRYELYTGIGKRIRDQREKRGLSRENLAERIDVSSRFLADIELGTKGMSLQTLMQLSKVLHVSTDFILFGDPDTPSSENIISIISEINPEYYHSIEELLISILNITQKATKKTDTF